MISPVSSGTSSPPPPNTSNSNNNNYSKNSNTQTLSAGMIGKGMMSGSEGLPQFLRKKVAFREATHSESLKGIVSAGSNNNNTGSAYVSYAVNKNKGCGDNNKPQKTTTSSRDAKYGFKMGEVDLFPKEQLAPFLKWSKIRSIGPGLTNLGNTCFLNSVLQCLFYTAPLAEFLLSRDHSKRCRTSKDEFCGLCTMERLMYKVHGGGCKESSFRPVELVMRLKSVGKHFRPGRQEDSHEFLRLFIETMQRASLPNNSDNQMMMKLDARSKETTAVHRIFGGHLQSTVTCSSCRHVSRTFDQFLDLSLDVNKADNLAAALKTFTTPELLSKSNRYKCEACHRLVEAHKQLSIYKTPEILTLQLKRFSVNPFTGQTSKLNRPVNFPESLDISEWISDKQQSGEGAKYRLYGVIVHEGHSCNSGHYHAFVKNSTGTWYSMNDCSVHQVSLDTVLRQRAYILFYQKCASQDATFSSGKKRSGDEEIVDIMTDKPPVIKQKKTMEEKMEALRAASRASTKDARDTKDTKSTNSTKTTKTTKDNTTPTDEEIPQLFSTTELRASSMWHMTPLPVTPIDHQSTASKRIRYNFQNSWQVHQLK